jgi:endoribonuclease LACTB2
VEVEMRPGIVLVPVKTPTIPPATHTNCYIVGGKEVIVIDPASPYSEEQALLDGVLQKRQVRIREIWLTHLHHDHVSGANHLRQRWGAPIAAHPITKQDLAGFVGVDREFSPYETLQLAGDPGWRLKVFHTPGHARGHVCVFEEKKGSLITGDLMAGFGTIVIDPPEGHMSTYLDSLRRMQELPVTALFPAHGPVLANAQARIGEYIAHRLQREKDILKAWESGIRDVTGIVETVYTDVAPAMYALAARSVTAHLEKLREEQRI